MKCDKLLLTVATAPEKIEKAETRLENLKSDRDVLRQLPIDAETKLPIFKITIDGTEYTDRKEAAQALEDVVLGFVKRSSDTNKEIGEFQGIEFLNLIVSIIFSLIRSSPVQRALISE